jgi:hypothetical protein
LDHTGYQIITFETNKLSNETKNIQDSQTILSSRQWNDTDRAKLRICSPDVPRGKEK